MYITKPLTEDGNTTRYLDLYKGGPRLFKLNAFKDLEGKVFARVREAATSQLLKEQHIESGDMKSAELTAIFLAGKLLSDSLKRTEWDEEEGER